MHVAEIILNLNTKLKSIIIVMLHTKMAVSIETSAASSNFPLNGTGNEDEFVCEKCCVSKTQLK